MAGIGKEPLSGPLCGDDNGVSALLQASFQAGQQPTLTFQVEIHFGNKDEIDILLGQGGGGGDESGVTAHEFDEADAVGVAAGLVVGADDGLGETSTAVSKPKEREIM